MSPSPVFSLSVPADVIVTGRAPHHFRIVVPVTSHGSLPLRVSVSAVSRTLLARQHPISPADISFSRPTFTIRDGQTVREVVTFRIPQSDTGKRVSNVMFTAQPLGKSVVRVRPAVATAVHLRLPGPTTWAAATPVPSVGPRAAPPAAGGASPLLLGGLAVAALLAVAAGLVMRQRRRLAHRRQPMWQEHPDR